MLQRLLISLFVLILTTTSAHALVELSGDYSYSRRVYGVDQDNEMVSTTTSGSIAVFLLNFLALEFNYGKSNQNVTEYPNILASGTTLTLTEYNNKVISETWGIGVRFSLAPQKARLRPDVSIGYANQSVTDSSTYTFVDSSDSSTLVAPGTTTRYKSDSVFGSFALNFRLTERLKLKTGVKTIFPAFKWDEAKDYLKYSIGFTWIL